MGKLRDLTGQIFGELTVLERDYDYIKEHNIKQNRPYWKCQCSCGKIITVKGSDLTTNIKTRCKKCSNKERMKDLSGKTFNFLTVLEPTEKRDSHRSIIFKCQCICGKVIEVSSHLLQSGDKKSCGCQTGQDRIVDLIGKRFGKLLVLQQDFDKKGYKKTGGVFWKCKCDCGNELSVASTHLQSGHTKSCGCLNQGYNLTNQKFGKLTVIEKVPRPENKTTANNYWLCECECGNKITTTASNLISGTTKSCGCLKSAGEYKIIQLLKNNNIIFETQKTFNSCRFPETNKLGYFDFYINNQFLLEYDGPQHFSYSKSGWDNLEYFLNITKKDNFKNKWCKENNIPLKRIPYWELKNIIIEDIMGDKFLLKES